MSIFASSASQARRYLIKASRRLYASFFFNCPASSTAILKFDITITLAFLSPLQPLTGDLAGGPSNLLDWGIAGQSSSTVIDGPSLDHPSNPPPPPDGSVRSVCHSTFSHWIDSRTDTPGPDQGDMYPQSNNTTLELGAMYNPLTNSEQAYEELWVDYSASAVEGTRWSVVIDLDDPEHNAKGRVIRVGEHCQGILKVGEHVTVERWEFEVTKKDTKGDWRRLARLGDLFLPVSLAFTPEGVIEGNTLTYGDYMWVVKEVYSW